MEDRSKHIDDLFREGLKDYQETPPASVWSSLEQRLPAADATVAEQPSRRWMWILLLLLLLAAVGFFIIKKSTESSSSEKKHLNEKIENNAPSAPNPTALPSEQGASKADNLHNPEGISLDETNNTATTAKTGTSNSISKKKVKSTAAWDGDLDKAGVTSESNDGVTQNTASSNNGTGNDKVGETGNGSDPDNGNPLNATGGQKTSSSNAVGGTKTQNNKAAKSTTTPANAIAKNKENTDEGPKANAGSKEQPGVAGQNSKGSNATVKDKSAVAKTNAGNTKTSPNTSAGTGNTNTAKASNEHKAATAKEVKEKPAATKAIASPELQTAPPKKAAVTEAPRKENIQLQNSTASQKKEPTTPSNAKAKSTAPEPEPVKAKEPQSTAKAANAIPVKPEPEIAKGKPIPVSPEKSASKPIILEPETGKGKAIDVSTSGGTKNKPIMVAPELNKNREIEIDPTKQKYTTPESVAKNNVAPQKNQGTAIPVPAAMAEKKAYERNEDGIVINMPIEEAEEEEEEQTPTPDDDGEEGPAQPAPKGGGGGGSKPDPKKPRKNFNKMKVEGGIKAGYERGIEPVTTNSFLIAPFLQWNISPRISLAVQPGAKYNQLSNINRFGTDKVYHSVQGAFRDSSHYTKPAQQGVDSVFVRKFIYGNSYDSIILGHQVKEKNYWEIEVPLMLKYYVSPSFSVFGGMSMTFGNMVQINERRQDYKGLQRVDSIVFPAVQFDSTQNAPYPNPPPPSMISFNYNTPDISTANPQVGQNPTTSPARFGLLFGFSYELRQRLLVDFMVRKNISDMKFIPNEQVRKIYTQPYLRLMVGYKLFGDKKERDVNPNGL